MVTRRAGTEVAEAVREEAEVAEMEVTITAEVAYAAEEAVTMATKANGGQPTGASHAAHPWAYRVIDGGRWGKRWGWQRG